MNILLGVTGSIAAYKAASLTSALTARGHVVRVCMTKAATKFVGPITFSALSHQPVFLDDDEWNPDGHIHHIELAQEWADKVVIAPASYDFLGKIVNHRADDLLSSICAAWDGFIHVCPAMNTVMWKTLNNMDWVIVDGTDKPKIMLTFKGIHRTLLLLRPAVGKLACGTEGEGAMRPTRDIVEFVEHYDS